MARKKYYRNRVEVSGCDPESLWYRSGEFVVLVDDDQFIQVEFDPTIFLRIIVPRRSKPR